LDDWICGFRSGLIRMMLGHRSAAQTRVHEP